MAKINAHHMLPVGTLLNGGKYVIRRHLSSGGFGNTYLAEMVKLGRLVALKEFFIKGMVMRDHDTQTVRPVDPHDYEKVEYINAMRKKFTTEARRIAALNSPHIVKVHDLFDDNDTSYYEMDYVAGGSVADLVHRRGPLSEQEAAEIALQVVDALEAVHAHRILHLDIKPANILLDNDGSAKLIDFGASKIIDVSDKTTTFISYSQGYAPPEQAEGNREAFGAWTDIYALGATLYFMLCDETPPMPYKILVDGFDSISQLPPAVGRKMAAMVKAMMNPKKADRPTLKEVKAAMKSIADDTDQTMPLPRGYSEYFNNEEKENTVEIEEETMELESPPELVKSEINITDENQQEKEEQIMQPNETPASEKLSKLWGSLVALLVCLAIVGISAWVAVNHKSSEYTYNELTSASPSDAASVYDGASASVSASASVDCSVEKPEVKTIKFTATEYVNGEPRQVKVTYTGEVLHGRANGYGKGVYGNNSTYEGNYRDNNREGNNGKKVYNATNYMEGTFENDVITHGVLVSGELRFEGDFNRNERPQNGTLTDKEDKVVAKYVDGKMKEV